jgi:sterol desaturase/sphingolipid hydroxylase (fatty acid hydroxylase superfamily)
MQLKEDHSVLDIVDFLEPVFQGRWEYLGGLILGMFALGLVRVLYKLWAERERKKDTAYIETHQKIPVEKLQTTAYLILASIVIGFLVVLPGILWMTVEILKRIESIDPGFAVLFILVVIILITVLLTIQGVRYKRLSRRIKLIKSQRG